AFVDVGLRDDEVVAGKVVVRLSVRDCRAQDLLELARGRPRGEREHAARLGDAPPADVLCDEPRLARGHPHESGRGPDLLALRGGHQLRFTSVLRSPEWPRKVRVGANSPSLCPTICSVMNTGTCLRPSWTAIVCPTISGKTVDARDHVRTICLL